MTIFKQNPHQAIVRPWHLMVFGFLIVGSIICNTQLGKKKQQERTEWAFYDDRAIIYAMQYQETSGKSIYQKLRVVLDGEMLYENKETNFINSNGILPIVRQLEGDIFEILMGFQNGNNENILHLLGQGNKLIHLDTLPLFRGNHMDKDRDGMPEFAGFLKKFPSYCLNCDSLYYNPYLFYEMRPKRFVLDTVLTQKWVERHYGVFRGFEPDSTILVKLKKPLTEI